MWRPIGRGLAILLTIAPVLFLPFQASQVRLVDLDPMTRRPARILNGWCASGALRAHGQPRWFEELRSDPRFEEIVAAMRSKNL